MHIGGFSVVKYPPWRRYRFRIFGKPVCPVKDDGAMAPFSDMAAGILDFGSVPWSAIDIIGFWAPFENFKGCTQG